ncbi:MAG TPA: right-handed parallel beta-helix repeat-containing protein [Chryseosolibacter sp.]|nr:right-handed parallel beta-helix repeat-containing protein [Chryseosolibacter sp.]
MRTIAKFLASAIVLFSLTQCADDETVLKPVEQTPLPEETSSLSIANVGTIISCDDCTYVVPDSTKIVDGTKLGIKAGDVICLSGSNSYASIIFRNIVGEPGNPVIIRSCGGVATIDGTGSGYTMKTERSRYIRITGGTEKPHGLRIVGGRMGLMLETLTSDVEVDRVEIANIGFAGIMAKTEPTCKDETLRGNFVMRNISLHHNYVHDTGGEGFYVGHSRYNEGITLSCGVRMPHEIHGVKIYNNVVVNAGWEAIQVGSTTKGAMVFNNRIENYGVANQNFQNNGIQFGEGAPGTCFANFINGGKGAGIIILGNAENFVHDNVILNAGSMGIFIDERAARGDGFRIVNNTIVNPGTDAIRLYSEYVPNVVMNNIIVNPGNFDFYTYPRSSADSYLYLLSKTVPVTKANNIFTTNISDLHFLNPDANNFRLTRESPAVDAGADISTYRIATDNAKQNRLRGATYDIGAYELQY